VLRMTNTPWAPWIIIEGEDDATLADDRKDPARRDPPPPGQCRMQTTPVAPPMRVNIDGRNLLSELNLNKSLTDKEYDEQLARLAGQAVGTVRDPRFKGRSLVCAFEGADAAGKGGASAASPRQ